MSGNLEAIQKPSLPPLTEDSPDPRASTEEIESFTEALLFEEEAKSEKIANYWRLGISLLFFAVTAGVSKEVPRFSVMVLASGSVLYLAFSLFMLFYLRAGKYNRKLKYVSVCFDILMTTVCMWAFGSYRTFKTEAFLLYFMWIALATMRLSERLTVFAGMLSLACYVSLVLLALITGSVTTGTISESFVSPKISLANQVLRVLYTSIVIFALTYGARSYRRLANKVYEKKIEAERERMRAQREEAQRKNERMLLKEMHHRTKNNLAIIQSLLKLQESSVQEQASREALRESSNRIHVISGIHELLYRSSDMTLIDMREHIGKLTDMVSRAFKPSTGSVSIHLDVRVEAMPVDDVLHISLIINELMTNSIKYAFGQDSAGSIWITLTKDSRHFILSVKDNGAGLPQDFNAKGSLGMLIVTSLVAQLKGTLEVLHNGGTEFRMTLPDRALQATTEGYP